MNNAVRVEGLAGLERAFKHASVTEQRLLRTELKNAAEPVKTIAQARATVGIRNMRRSPRWAAMRIGYARNVVYMVPKQRSTKVRSRRRPNLKNLLLDRSMLPALQQNKAEVEQRVQRVLDTVGQQWERV